ncbi:MAG TPA: ABC transporter substrate binding protein, partial [Bryobacteraceae bacterium]
MKRRKFITLLGGAAGMAVAGRAQQRMRRIGILMPGSENDALWHMNAAVARKALAELGWNEGLNLRVELRFGEGDAGRISDQARELVRLAPEVILTASAAAGRALKQETQTIPVVVAGSGS